MFESNPLGVIIKVLIPSQALPWNENIVLFWFQIKLKLFRYITFLRDHCMAKLPFFILLQLQIKYTIGNRMLVNTDYTTTINRVVIFLYLNIGICFFKNIRLLQKRKYCTSTLSTPRNCERGITFAADNMFCIISYPI